MSVQNTNKCCALEIDSSTGQWLRSGRSQPGTDGILSDRSLVYRNANHRVISIILADKMNRGVEEWSVPYEKDMAIRWWIWCGVGWSCLRWRWRARWGLCRRRAPLAGGPSAWPCYALRSTPQTLSHSSGRVQSNACDFGRSDPRPVPHRPHQRLLRHLVLVNWGKRQTLITEAFDKVVDGGVAPKHWTNSALNIHRSIGLR